MNEQQPSIGPYQVRRSLGSGGMGEVFLAYDPRLDREVAIKRIRSDVGADDERRARFQREARLAASLNHPSIVQVFDLLTAGELEHIVMEHVPGNSLRAALDRDGPMELRTGLRVALSLAEGLAYAHRRGVVHRDLKSENVLITPGGRAKVADFGIARRLLVDGKAQRDATLTLPGNIIGTYRAMSPEQLCGDPVDLRSDLFSFGVLLYETFTARSPFRGQTRQATIQRILHHQPPPVHELVPDLPNDLSMVIDHLLEKDPLLRPRDAEEVREHLASVGSELDQAMGATAVSPAMATAGRGASERSLSTLVVSDLVASTALVAQLGDRAAMAWSERHDRMARNLLRRHGGREIDKSDGFLLLFERSVEAVDWALDYHAALDSLSAGLSLKVQARVGIHLGEVFLRRNPPEAVRRGAKPLEVEGLAKSMAARLMALAEGGQTLMSRGAFDLAQRATADHGEDGADLCWFSHGRYRLKGVEEPVEVCEVQLAGSELGVRPPDSSTALSLDTEERTAQQPSRRRLWTAVSVAVAMLLVAFGLWRLASGPPAAPISVAVLRPQVQGDQGDPKINYLSFVLRSALLRHLTSFPDLSPRTSAEVDVVYDSPPTEIARAVGADELLITNFACRDQGCLAELSRVRGSDGGVLHAYRMEIPVDEPLTVARAVRMALGQLYPEAARRSVLATLAAEPEDYASYVEVRRRFERMPGSQELEAMLGELAGIRSRSPRFLDAYLLEAEVASLLYQEKREQALLARVFERLQQAEELAPQDSFVRFSRARIEIHCGRLDAAEATLDQLEQALPGSVQILDTRAYLQEQRGEVEHALELYRAAIERRPTWQRLYNHAFLAQRLGQVEETRSSLEALLSLSPGNLLGLGLLARLELENGDPKQAVALYNQLLQRSSSPVYLTNLGLAHMLERDYAASAHAFAEAVRAAPKNPIYLLNLADARALEGRKAEAATLYREVLALLDADPSSGPQQLTMRAQALAHLGQRRAAVATVQSALQQAPGQGPVAFEAALVYALVGDYTAAEVNAAEALELGRNVRWFRLPWFDDLRVRPEFARLLAEGADPV